MGYLHIDNLYKKNDILSFRNCYALEKIHGTSAHIKWHPISDSITFYSGGASYDTFVSLFDANALKDKFKEIFPERSVTVFGEAYGGKMQKMSDTYGKELKFVAFDVYVGNGKGEDEESRWVSVPQAEEICNNIGIEFVDYELIPTDMEYINAERDKPSVQAIRNGCGNDKIREGVVLRPPFELTLNNGKRLIAKHKHDKFGETKTPRKVSDDQLQVLEDANKIAEEWVTPMRLTHVLDKLSGELNALDRIVEEFTMKDTRKVMDAMAKDIYREAKGEIVESKEVIKSIERATAKLFKAYLSDI